MNKQKPVEKDSDQSGQKDNKSDEQTKPVEKDSDQSDQMDAQTKPVEKDSKKPKSDQKDDQMDGHTETC